MSAGAPVTYAADAERVGWIRFDDPAGRANVFNAATRAALGRVLDEAAADAEAQRVQALVIMSGKPRIFMAGADLNELAGLADARAAEAFARAGQGLFQRIAESRVPVVAAIHGACAGGGFELALACHWRVATEAPETQIGLPETSLGTIPGWGGSVRLPRLIGLKAALDHILKGQLIRASAARETGLVNELVPPGQLEARAKAAALKLASEGFPARAPQSAVPQDAIEALRAAAGRRPGASHQPAWRAAIDAAEQAAGLPLVPALEVEARYFGEVTAGLTCKNLIRVFQLKEAAKKRTLEAWYPSSGDRAQEKVPARAAASGASGRPASPLRRVGVVGAGVMGSGIAQWLAAQGCEVVMRDVQPEVVERGMTVVRGLFDEAVKRGKYPAGEANAALHRVRATTSWDGFAECELVIEAIVERAAAKQALFTELAGIVGPGAILASNTSALPIDEITGHVARPERTIGIHFFNPVSRMPLVELVLARATSAETAERALALVKALGKTAVVCRSSPGFLVTRVLFFYLNAAVALWEEGVGAAELDGAMKEFGWPMGPLRLIDEVGIDVTDFIFGEMAHYFPGRFARSTACGRLLAAGLHGRKNGASRGFYRYDGGEEASNEPEARTIAGGAAARGATIDEAGIVARLMAVMVDEAQRCLDEGVIKSADDVDFALLSGAGFPAFRGGLMHWARGARSEAGRGSPS